MRTLTICQPYAHAIIHGTKRCENRDWNMRYRGPLLIHAGKSRAWISKDALGCYPGIVFGAVIGRVEVVDCLEAEAYVAKYGDDAWGCFGRFCIRVVNPLAFAQPIPWKGQLGLFDVPDAAVKDALAGVAP
jgi:hypothetical protein